MLHQSVSLWKLGDSASSAISCCRRLHGMDATIVMVVMVKLVESMTVFLTMTIIQAVTTNGGRRRLWLMGGSDYPQRSLFSLSPLPLLLSEIVVIVGLIGRYKDEVFTMDLNSLSDGWTPMPSMLVVIIIAISIVLIIAITVTIAIAITEDPDYVSLH